MIFKKVQLTDDSWTLWAKNGERLIPLSGTIILTKGQNLAPTYFTADFDDLLVGTTNYETSVETGIWHSHEKPMISFVLYGSNVENRKGKVIQRTPGSINFYHSYEPHKNTYTLFPSKHISLELDHELLNRYEYSESEIEVAVANSQEPIFTFIKMMNELQLNDSHSANTVELLFLEFMENSRKITDISICPSWVRVIRDVLNDRWNENLSLKELSEETRIHPTSISKHFGRYFRCTLGEYTRKLKVMHSIKLIHSANHSLTDIAYICGFSDQSHFTRTFKSMTGYCPKAFEKV